MPNQLDKGRLLDFSNFVAAKEHCLRAKMDQSLCALDLELKLLFRCYYIVSQLWKSFALLLSTSFLMFFYSDY